MMSKNFKVGDRVRVIDDKTHEYTIGSTLTVTQIGLNDNWFTCELSEGNYNYIIGSDLQLASEPYVHKEMMTVEAPVGSLIIPPNKVGALSGLNDAAQEFVDRCERGEIKSKYTLDKFKRILNDLKLNEILEQ